jgi:hypothetical protein
MKKFTAGLILCISFATALFSQSGPCTNTKAVDVLMKNSTYVAECDSLIVLNKVRYDQLTKELIYYKDLYKDYQKLANSMDEKSSLLENHINNLDAYIGKQEKMVENYRTLFVESDSLVDRSTKNTDRALDELKKARWKLFLYSTAAIVVGGTLGYTAGQVGN